jgi:protein phosphatase
MLICDACGTKNRAGARFCYSCAAPLPAFRPSDTDRAWLAASLEAGGARAVTSDTGPLVPATAAPAGALTSVQAQEETMDQPASAPAPALFAGRYELPDPAPAGPIAVTDAQPWRRCWACGSTANEAGESFCIDCGAALEKRSYRGALAPSDALAGVALIKDIADETARAMLPEVWDQVEDGGRTLTLLHDSGRAPISPPLDETAALAVGLGLARLLTSLHAQGFALGNLAPADIELLPGGKARLRDAPALRRVPEAERAAAATADLAASAELLEQLSATPRTTQRLSEDEASDAIADAESGVPGLLRELRTGAITSAADLAARLDTLLAERTRPVSLRQIVGAASHVGIVREHNEDSYLTIGLGLDNNGQRHGWGVYIVSDGMGGHAAGEVASGLAIRAAAEIFLGEYLGRAIGPAEPYSEADARDIVRRAVLKGNEAIVAEARAQGNDMGATFTMALVVGDRVTVGNVGDSRTYLYRDGKLRRISKDHSLVMRLVDIGQISDEDVYTHPQRNAVLRSLGDKLDVEVDLFNERVRPGDALLLCSDGQWEMTRDAEMERLLARPDDPQKICDELVSAANQAGGEDNISVVLVRFE